MATQNTLTGTLFAGRYRVTRKLGGGGMADVYLAEDQELGRRVAIKILHGRYANDEQFVERFRREATHAAGLSHPNIVSIFDRGETDGSYFIVMEYVEGRTLKELIRSRGPCPIPVAIAYTRQILVRAPLRAPQRRRAPRHQAAQRDRRPRGRRQGDGLRHRPRRREPDDGGGRDHRHRAVPLARSRRAARRSTRPPTSTRPAIVLYELLTGARAVLGRDARRDRDEAPVGAAPDALRPPRRRCRTTSTSSSCARSRRSRATATSRPPRWTPTSRRSRTAATSRSRPRRRRRWSSAAGGRSTRPASRRSRADRDRRRAIRRSSTRRAGAGARLAVAGGRGRAAPLAASAASCSGDTIRDQLEGAETVAVPYVVGLQQAQAVDRDQRQGPRRHASAASRTPTSRRASSSRRTRPGRPTSRTGTSSRSRSPRANRRSRSRASSARAATAPSRELTAGRARRPGRGGQLRARGGDGHRPVAARRASSSSRGRRCGSTSRRGRRPVEVPNVVGLPVRPGRDRAPAGRVRRRPRRRRLRSRQRASSSTRIPSAGAESSRGATVTPVGLAGAVDRGRSRRHLPGRRRSRARRSRVPASGSARCSRTRRDPASDGIVVGQDPVGGDAGEAAARS